MSEESRPLTDRTARAAIATELDRTLFVEAGAGTGKTTELVARVVSLVTSGAARLDSMAVITFTRAAAAELRQHVRDGLEARVRAGGLDPEARARLEAALEELDYAAIQTIDSFALSLLRERPLEAGLPPVVESRDEIEAALAFEDAWRDWLVRALDEGGFAGVLNRAARLGLRNPIDQARAVAERFHANYDLLEGVRFGEAGSTPLIAADDLLARAPRLRGLARCCNTDEDRLKQRLDEVLDLADEIERADPEDRPYLMAQMPSLAVSRTGNAGNWEEAPEGGRAHLLVREQLADLHEVAAAELDALRAGVLGELADHVAGFALEYARARRANGLAEFTDLLVWACEMLESSPAARQYFRRRHSHLLIDEFQDTDPRQVRLALLLTAGADGEVPEPGSLFVVGDPKQSIYGWRRADLPTVMDIRRRLREGLLYLRQNFRAHRGLIDWTNAVFESWIGEGVTAQQAEYVPLHTDVEAPGPGWGAAVIGEALPELNVAEIRELEAAEVARVAAAVGAGKWQVRAGEGGVRQSEYRDMAILIRSRTGLATLEQALEDAGVPFRAAGESLAFATQEARDLLAALTAIEDPSDQVALVAALRSPAYGCSDPDLYRWAKEGGAFDYLQPAPPGRQAADGPVARAFESLRGFHEQRMTGSVPELIERFVRERRLREVALGSGRASERLGHLTTVIESARHLGAARRPSLREFLAWMRDRADGRTRVAESADLVSRDNVVRVMTIHAAKGLEFPIVLLAGLNSAPQGEREPVLFDYRAPPSERAGVRLGPREARFESPNYAPIRERQKDAGDYEDARLMYVACTRAKDHLVVSLYRKEDDTRSLAARLAFHSEGAVSLQRNLSPAPAVATPAPAAEPEAAVAASPGDAVNRRAAWIASRRRAIAAAAAPGVMPASSLHEKTVRPASAPEKTETEEREQEPGRRGRAARDLGRAVHAALEDVSLEDPSALPELARRHAAAHGLGDDDAAEVQGLAEGVLATGVMGRAAAAARRGRCWREAYVSMPLNDNGAGLEGFIDLVFEEEDGSLTIVDYKTDRDSSWAEHHETQLGAYAAAVERATGRRVGQAVLVYARLAPDRPGAERPVADLAAAREQAIAIARARVVAS